MMLWVWNFRLSPTELRVGMGSLEAGSLLSVPKSSLKRNGLFHFTYQVNLLGWTPLLADKRKKIFGDFCSACRHFPRSYSTVCLSLATSSAEFSDGSSGAAYKPWCNQGECHSPGRLFKAFRYHWMGQGYSNSRRVISFLPVHKLFIFTVIN